MCLRASGKCCCVFFFVLLTWSHCTTIGKYSATASVSSRLRIVYVQGCLFELAVPVPTMTSPTHPSAAAAPVTLNWASCLAADHVTAADRPPEHRTGSATYTLQRLLQLRSGATGSQTDSLKARLNQLGIAKGSSRRGVRGGRKSHRPIPVHVTSRPVTERACRGRQRLSGSGQRCLARPPRLSFA